MIVAGPDGFMKSQYRKFNIRQAEVAGDDFGMMREVLTRRFSRLLRETGEGVEEPSTETPQWPDLVLIDGGQGQLSAARTVLEELGIHNVPLAGVAKVRTGTPAGNTSTSTASPASCSRPVIRCCTMSSGCATRPTALPSALTGRGVPGPSDRTPWTRFLASDPRARRPCSKALDRRKQLVRQMWLIWLP